MSNLHFLEVGVQGVEVAAVYTYAFVLAYYGTYFATQLRSATAALAARPYLVSDEFTAADLLLTSVLLWARNEGWLPDEPVLHEYVERNAARPACEALQRMKRELPSGTAPVEIFPS